jgi:hypothetical protein
MNDLNTFYYPQIRKSNFTVYGIYGNILPFSYYNFYIRKCNINQNNNCYKLIIFYIMYT